MDKYIKSITKYLLELGDYDNAYQAYNSWVTHTGNIVRDPDSSQWLLSFIKQFKTSDKYLVRDSLTIY